MPRLMRRLFRLVDALCTGRIAFPPRTGAVCAGVFMGSTVLYGAVLGGHMGAAVEGASVASGFAVNHVAVSGNVHTSPIDVLQQIGVDENMSLLTVDPKTIRAEVRKLAWVEDAEVRKVYPDNIVIALKERQPFAIWQHGHDLSVIERSGSVIAPLLSGEFAHLPLFVGLGAETRARAIQSTVSRWPSLAARVKAYVRVADRRWDLHLDNGVTVRLPEHGVETAMAELAAMDEETGLLSRDIVAVDLRLSDRVTVRLSPEADKARDEAIEERNKALKLAEKRA